MTESITVLSHFYRLMTPEEKADMMTALEISSRHTLRRYISDPYSMSIRQGFAVVQFIKERFEVEIALDALSKDLHDLIKNSDPEGRKRITRRLPNYKASKQ